MILRQVSLLLTSLLMASSVWAGTFSFTCSTSKEPVSYQPGESMQFKVQLTEDGRPLAGKTLNWLRTGDDGQTANGEAVSSDKQPLEITNSIARPGFIRIEVSAFNPDGSPLKDAAGETVKFDGGAGVQPEKLEGYPEPADFDAFWQKQKARLAEIPITAELKEVAAKQSGFKVYDVKIACAGKRPVTGYLSIPADAKGKSLSAQVGFHGYGVSGSDQQCQAGTIFFDVNAHGIENGREPEYYKALREGELKNYGLINEENAKPGTAYFNGMMLRAMRALQYVKTRPEWNGRDLLVSGGSQGGFQAIAAAALDQQVTGCYAWKPWCCDLGGIKLNRLRGWRPDFADGLGYYDTATMGRRVTCETTIVAGLGDYVCPPSGLAVLYNNLKSAKKSIEFTQGATHGTQPAGAVKQVLRFAALEIHVSPAGNDANDGSTPQRAFRSLAAACRGVPAGKHTIRIAAGDYEEKESCILPAGVSLIGAGTGKTVFRWNAVRDLDKKPMEYDFAAFLIQMKDSADATISGLTIIGSLPEDKRAHGGIIAQGVRNVAIHDCELRGFEFTGVWLSQATNSSVHHCRFDDCAHPSKESCSGGLQLGTLTDCTIHHNVIREKRGAYGIKTWVPLWTALRNNWFELGRNKVKLVRVHIHDNDIKVRQQGGWGNGQPNMALELWNSDPVECEIYGNRFNECVSLVEGAKGPNTIRIHHNLFILEPGYSYAIEAGHHNLEIDHNVFRNGFYPIASFGGAISGLNIHDNTFDGIENIAVCLLPGVSNFRFVNNTVVVKKDMPILVAEKERGKPSHSKDVTIADNLLVKEGAPSQAKVLELKDGSDLAPGTLTMRDNAFWNWTPAGETAMTADPQLERAADGDHLLRMSSKSPVRAAGKGADAGVAPDAGKLSGKFGDQGDGTFRNPIIASDYSDPCTIRVGEDYYMATSTFHLSPGVTILHSRDLVNWKTIGAAISDISTLGADLNWDRMDRYERGVYAPTLRYHDGKFWVFVNCVSGEGFYVCTAKDPAGPWDVRQIQDKNGKPLRTHQWTDPCPFWDDNGKAYLASSRPGANWFGYLFEMTPDGTRLLDADVEHMNSGDKVYEYPRGGTRFSPFQSTEGNKIFKRNGYYYLLHIEFFDTGQGRGTYVFRSKNIYGTKPDGTPGKPGDPGKYEVFKLGPVGEAFYQKNLEIPGQGGFVDTPDGRWFWIAQFDRYGSEGRPPNLIPVTWVNDWPVPGVDVNDRQGKMAWQLVKPIPGQPATLPQGRDDFNTPRLDPQWMWNYQPRAGKWSLTERPGFLRLHAFKQLEPGNFFKTGNVLCQRHLRTDKTEATVKFDLAGMADGQEAGLAHFNGGKNYALIAVTKSGGRLAVLHRQDGGGTAGPELPAGTNTLWLRTTAGFDNQCRFAFSTDGKTFTLLGGAFTLTNKSFRGDLVGLYTCNNQGESGFLDVDQFDYETR